MALKLADVICLGSDSSAFHPRTSADSYPSHGFPRSKIGNYFFPELAFETTAKRVVLQTGRNKKSRHDSSPTMGKKSAPPPALHLGANSFDELKRSNAQKASSTSANTLPSKPKPWNWASRRPSTSRSANGPPPPIQTDMATPPKSPDSDDKEQASLVSSATTTAIPQFPPSPREPPSKHGRDPSKSFFSNFRASRSTHKIQSESRERNNSIAEQAPEPAQFRSQSPERGLSSHGESDPKADLSSSPVVEKTPGTTDEDPNTTNTSITTTTPITNPITATAATAATTATAAAAAAPTNANANASTAQPHTLTTKKSKPRFAHILTRTRSIRIEDPASLRPSTAARRPSQTLPRVEISKDATDSNLNHAGLNPAPVDQERATHDMTSSSRNRSAERPAGFDEGSSVSSGRSNGRFGQSLAPNSQPSSSSLFSNIKSSSSGAADRIGRAGKGLFGKISRSASSNDRDGITGHTNGVPDDQYVCQVINKPLLEQVRRTRISKRLDACKDKTEYWMPALPWRCIDYLNFKGCEEEGLYRVPGSGKDVKHWQRRFDSELDIDLFDEPELYDINTIGSMFKAWLRELPDDILPKDTQTLIADKCAGATTAPQLLRDELSKLPPFNYYLLFAITCHLSLLHSYVDKNKMDYRNLCICFQPCMRIDAFCFQFLVCDWKRCWQGCWTEKEYLAIELEHERQVQEQANREREEHEALERARKQQADDDNRPTTSASSSHLTSISAPADTNPSSAASARRTIISKVPHPHIHYHHHHNHNHNQIRNQQQQPQKPSESQPNPSSSQPSLSRSASPARKERQSTMPPPLPPVQAQAHQAHQAKHIKRGSSSEPPSPSRKGLRARMRPPPLVNTGVSSTEPPSPQQSGAAQEDGTGGGTVSKTSKAGGQGQHARSMSQLPELGPPLSPIRI